MWVGEEGWGRGGRLSRQRASRSKQILARRRPTDWLTSVPPLWGSVRVPGLSKATDTSYQALATVLSLLEITTSVEAQGTSSPMGFLRTVSQAEAGLLGWGGVLSNNSEDWNSAWDLKEDKPPILYLEEHPHVSLSRYYQGLRKPPTDRVTSSSQLSVQSWNLGPLPGPWPIHMSHQFDTLPTTEALVDIPLGQVVHRPLVYALLGCELSFCVIR